MEWSTACPDWEKRLVGREAIIPRPIYQDQAERALEIFKELRVVDMPGKPSFGECSEQWVFDFVAAIFGAYDEERGKQLIREYGLLISKKNTKSTIAAGIMLTALILCWREGEEHLILAPTKEVADNSYKPAAAMVREDEELINLFHIQDHLRTITHRVNGNSLKVVAADTDTVSGKKAGRVLVDELWIFGKRSNAGAMFMEALGGQASRDEGWVIYLTTQSDEPPAGVFKDKLDYWRDIRDGKLEDKKTLPVLYEFPDEMVQSKAYEDPSNFYITNPNIGRSVNAEWLTDNLIKNKAKTDGSFQQFLAKHLDIQIGLNLRSDRWPGADFWEVQAVPKFTLDDMIRECEVIDVGIDGGGLDDLLGFAATGRKPSGEWKLWTHAWAHPSVLERRKDQVTKFEGFRDDGDMTFVETIGQDFEQVAELVARIHKAQLLDLVGLDASGIGGIKDALVKAKVPVEKLVAISQGWQMHGAIKTTERKLAEGTLVHPGQRLMNYCVSNAKQVARGNAVVINKQNAGSAKIDPLMATFNAVTLMSLNPKSPKPKFQMLILGGQPA